MSLSVRHNLGSLTALRHIERSDARFSIGLQRLSGGHRVNSGRDAPADLIISEQLRAQISGIKRAIQNTQEATNAFSIAEGAHHEISEILKSLRGLTLHAANSGVTSPKQISANQVEVDSGIQTIDRIVSASKYADEALLNGNRSIHVKQSFAITGPNNHPLVDISSSRFYQIPYSSQPMNISFVGTDNPDRAGIGNASFDNIAKKSIL